jgi:hypothetical protein
MEYLFVCMAALLVAGLTFFSGFGLGTLLMPVFALFFPLDVAIAATAVVHLANNLFKVLLVGRHANLMVLLRFAVPAALAALVGAILLERFVHLAPLLVYSLGGQQYAITPLKLVIAVIIAVFAVIELAPAFRKLAFSPRMIPVGGLLSGFFGGLSGHQGALRAAFLIRAGLDKKALIATMVMAAIVVDMVRLTVYGVAFTNGIPPADHGPIEPGLVIAASAAAFLGSFVGARLLEKVTLPFIKNTIAGMLVLLAAGLAAGIL